MEKDRDYKRQMFVIISSITIAFLSICILILSLSFLNVKKFSSFVKINKPKVNRITLYKDDNNLVLESKDYEIILNKINSLMVRQYIFNEPDDTSYLVKIETETCTFDLYDNYVFINEKMLKIKFLDNKFQELVNLYL